MSARSESTQKLVRQESRDALIYVLSNALIQFGSLITVPLFWQKLTPEDYGIIAIIDIIGSFLGVILGLSLNQSISKFYYEWTEEQKKRGIGAIWVLSWASSFAFGAVSLLVFSSITPHLFANVNFYPYVFMGIIAIILTSLGQITLATIRIKRLPYFYAVYSVSVFVLYLFLRIYFVLWGDEGLVGYYKANIIGAALVALAAVVIMSRFARPCIRNGGLTRALKFSLPIIPSSALGAVVAISDRLILQNYVDLSTLGIYSIALKFASAIMGLHEGIKLSYGPFLWKTVNTERNAKNIIAQVAPLFIGPIFIAGLFLSLFVKDIIVLINRPLYFPVADYMPLVAGFTVISCFYLYYSPGIMISGRTGLLWIPSLIQLIAISSGFFLAPRYEIFGVIASKYIAVLLFLGVSFYLSQRVFGIDYRLNKLAVMVVGYLWCLVASTLLELKNPLLNISVKATIFSLYLLLLYFILRSIQDELWTKKALASSP